MIDWLLGPRISLQSALIFETFMQTKPMSKRRQPLNRVDPGAYARRVEPARSRGAAEPVTA
ncbi:hypothetical protein MKK84_13235 [Methylobacterium sp. E-065]|uniref:hypothetical protein n=1 Tax=Methylobacterium sp. E-065 TaxID=2836583 RepID=UPI001FBBC74E|nr:hypothetical protein [Methylobacterium sp. E-065]MCJ2018383.1 hypothetical protein [Methylobacterium sp. E-065]